ncbi:flagellar assembly protein FliH [Marinobacter persicus]|uniref:Flagellar assembly protein FliH n=1 Tax=Marinobacter persicus TaxID=930118 RepID=A0A2S6G7C8_9GAMM|nr:flagellar assembly protein FliH [Marinobacter persicus]PPK52001.1 flagellar assembly protein FliH [Marinobacter persicus]PPK55037.1 flagellar assembly protein FliH [Marinobacter persicus]PPK58398.1 flagellar assembly protein FliH [Marinobacter persicus]
MRDSDQDRKTRPKEQMTAWERWELPLLDEQGNEVAQEAEVKPMTAGELQEIRQAAQDDGFKEGREEGYKSGLEQGRADGREEGFAAGQEEGREQGRQQGVEDTRQQMAATMDRLEHLMGELVLPIKRHEEELETALVNLTTALARSVVYRELTLDSSQIRQVVRQALAALPSTTENLRIHIHPDDLEPVREVTERLEVTPNLIEDDSLLPGGCKVQTRHSLVDYTVEKRFQHAIQNMLEEQFGEPVDAIAADTGMQMGELTDFHRDVLESSAMEPLSSSPQSGDEPEEDDDLPAG